MSGIIGIYHLDGRHSERSLLLQMTEALAHRGPDGSDIWQDGPVGLGHCMLRTTPESLTEQLPFTSHDGTLTITSDARIDNREELIAALDLHPGDIPDSALILSAYERWGTTCADRLLGDFAFAIWDAQKRHLFCARDQMGVKPFYYHLSDGLFAFASEMKALFRIPSVTSEVNEEQILEYLVSRYNDSQTTFYQSISRLPAATTVTVTDKDHSFHQYWHLDPRRNIHYNTSKEYEAAFRSIFTDAVRCRMRSAFPLGVVLSGGLDSSSVFCIARDLWRQDEKKHQLPIHSFSAVFDDVSDCDERPYISRVLAGGDTIPHFVRPEKENPLILGREYPWRKDDPLDDHNLFITWNCYESAQKPGVRILLDGFFGDTTISYGGGSLADLTRRLQWFRVLREAAGIAKHWNIPLRKVIGEQVLFRSLPPRFRLKWRERRNRPVSDDVSRLNPGMRQRYFDGTRQSREEIALLLNSARDLHWFDLTWPARQRDFENLDEAGAALGLDLRHPFSDRRLVEFCLALPPEQKIRGGYTRAILRYALSGSVPEEIRTRAGKADLDLVFHHCMRMFQGMDLEEMLFRDPRQLGRYVDIPSLREAYLQFRLGNTGHAAFLWRVARLQLWLDQIKPDSLPPE